MGYKSTVTEIGPMVQDFIGEKMIIVFNDNAPAALRGKGYCRERYHRHWRTRIRGNSCRQRS